MSLRELIEQEDNEQEEESGSSGEKYADKMQPTPNPHTFLEEREADWAVGPDLTDIGGIEGLIQDMRECETPRDWSFVLNEHIKWGNNSKVDSRVGIVNMNSGTDCINRWSDRCQVGGDECYQVKDEKRYPYVLDFTRRQEYLWDSLDAQTWVEAFEEILKRKRNEVIALKFSQAGDFRHEGDIIKANYIADRLAEHDILVFTYSASSHLDWSHATSDNFVVNQSNDREDYGERRYRAVDSKEDIREDELWCPYDRSKHRGASGDEKVKCGECKACITPEAPDIAVTK